MTTEDDLVRGIGIWTEVESPTTDATGVNRVMDLVCAEAEAAGIGVERIAGRDGLGDCIVLRAGPDREDRGILLLSHLDTVHPLGTLGRDLPVRRDGDRLYGPGVLDMKGGAYVAFRAFLDVVRRGEGRRPSTFLFTPDEEIGSPTSRGVIETLASRSAFALVTEPARDGGRVVTARKGVGRFEVAVEGRPAHSGTRHEDGRSAIREAALQVGAVDAMTEYDRGVTTSVGLISGGTAANVVPQHCRFSVDLRVVTAADGELYSDRIRGLQPIGPDVAVTVSGGMNRPPYERSDAGVALFGAARAAATRLGLPPLEEAPRTGGGSDGNFTAALGVPTLDGLGVAGEGAHTLGEYARISSFMPRYALIRELLGTL